MTNSDRRPAVFLDRDGTIIEDRGHIGSPTDVVVYPFAADSLRLLLPHFLLFIVTNQLGISKGLVTREQVDEVNDHVVSVLRDRGIEITEVYVCPHTTEDACECRKPNPYFPKKAAAEYGIDLHRSFTIGDHPADVELGRNAGAKGLYVLTGHGGKHRHELPDDTDVFPSLREAVDQILSISASR